jgi:hypothetical protein
MTVTDLIPVTGCADPANRQINYSETKWAHHSGIPGI